MSSTITVTQSIVSDTLEEYQDVLNWYQIRFPEGNTSGSVLASDEGSLTITLTASHQWTKTE